MTAWKKARPKSSGFHAHGVRPLDALEELGVGDRVGEVRAEQVGAQPLWRLVGHLDAVLEHRDGEVGRRRRREPQPEVGVRAVGREVLADLLERRHPRDGEVAVLEHHPAAALQRLGDQPLRDRPLPLAERDRLRLRLPPKPRPRRT